MWCNVWNKKTHSISSWNNKCKICTYVFMKKESIQLLTKLCYVLNKKKHSMNSWNNKTIGEVNLHLTMINIFDPKQQLDKSGDNLDSFWLDWLLPKDKLVYRKGICNFCLFWTFFHFVLEKNFFHVLNALKSFWCSPKTLKMWSQLAQTFNCFRVGHWIFFMNFFSIVLCFDF